MPDKLNFVENSRGQPVQSRYSELTLRNRERTLKGINPTTVGQVLNGGDPVALELVKLGRLTDPRGQSPTTRTPAGPARSTVNGVKTEKQGTSTATESNDLKNPNFRAATDFDKNNPFKNLDIAEDRSFGNNRYSAGRFDINSFRSKVVNNDGVLSTHSFLVVFSPMDWVPLKAIRNEIFPDLTMRCDNAILPTINLLQEQNVRRYGFGPVENVAYGVNVGDFTLQFIVDKEASIIDFFESWMNLIVNRDSFGGANMNNVIGDNKRPYEVAYKDTYACPSVNVFVYDRAQNTVLEYNIYDVFPTGIQSMNLSWSEENSLMKLNVTFSFTDLRIRSKQSNFDNETAVSWAEMLNTAPIAVTTMGDQPLVDAASIVASIPADLANQPLVIGEGNNGVPRSFGVPGDTGPITATTPDVPTATIRDAFGQENIIA